jgi:hypothetical protein
VPAASGPAVTAVVSMLGMIFLRFLDG